MASSLIHNSIWGLILIACYDFDLDHSLWSIKSFLWATSSYFIRQCKLFVFISKETQWELVSCHRLIHTMQYKCLKWSLSVAASSREMEENVKIKMKRWPLWAWLLQQRPLHYLMDICDFLLRCVTVGFGVKSVTTVTTHDSSTLLFPSSAERREVVIKPSSSVYNCLVYTVQMVTVTNSWQNIHNSQNPQTYKSVFVHFYIPKTLSV